MPKYVILVTLLITLGIISCNPARGDTSKQETTTGVNTDTTIKLIIRQFCCKNGVCYTTVEGLTCDGTFEILLEKSNIGSSQPLLENGEREIPITIIGTDGNPEAMDTNNLNLLRSIETMLFTQYGPTELRFESNDRVSLKDTKQPRNTKANKVELRAIPTTSSAEEYDEPQMIYVKAALFKQNYSVIIYQKKIHEKNSSIICNLPKYKPSEKHDEVKPIGFSKTEIDRIRLEVLYKTNYYRSLYGMKELRPDDNINYIAQDWANHLADKANPLSLNSTLEHRIPENQDFDYYGENVFTSLPIKHVGEVAVDICYYEVGSIAKKQRYGITKHEYENIKRLTQLLWKVTESIGVGAAIGNDGKYYVVMNFNPRGNVENFMAENIPKFPYVQIDEAKIKLDSINENSDILLDRLEKGSGVRSLPGWKTMLYEWNVEQYIRERITQLPVANRN